MTKEQNNRMNDCSDMNKTNFYFYSSEGQRYEENGEIEKAVAAYALAERYRTAMNSERKLLTEDNNV